MLAEGRPAIVPSPRLHQSAWLRTMMWERSSSYGGAAAAGRDERSRSCPWSIGASPAEFGCALVGITPRRPVRSSSWRHIGQTSSDMAACAAGVSHAFAHCSLQSAHMPVCPQYGRISVASVLSPISAQSPQNPTSSAGRGASRAASWAAVAGASENLTGCMAASMETRLPRGSDGFARLAVGSAPASARRAAAVGGGRFCMRLAKRTVLLTDRKLTSKHPHPGSNIT